MIADTQDREKATGRARLPAESGPPREGGAMGGESVGYFTCTGAGLTGVPLPGVATADLTDRGPSPWELVAKTLNV